LSIKENLIFIYMKPNIGILDKKLRSSVSMLEALLSNEMILYIKTRKSHWNVTGESFMELHKLFEEQYQQLEASADEIAERIGKLGQNTIGTMTEFQQRAAIKESPGSYLSSKQMLKELLADHETLVIQIRKDVEDCASNNNDAGTVDFLTKLMEQHETKAWVLRRYLS
jgi:starvation-inducible DNA-binding protein